MEAPAPLSPESLYTACPDEHLPFATTAELEDGDGLFGQQRALDAIDFGIDMAQAGHNVFVAGPPGTGRRSFVERFLTRRASIADVPSDWCYVNDFDCIEKPAALELPAGAGPRLAHQVDDFIVEVQAAVSAALGSDEYRARREAIEQQFQAHQAEAFERIQAAAAERDIRVMTTPGGLVFAPLADGEVVDPEAFKKLPQARQDALQKAVEELGRLFQDSMREMPERLRESREQIRALDREVATFAIERLTANLKSGWNAIEVVSTWLDSLHEDLTGHYEILREPEDPEQLAALRFDSDEEQPALARARRRYGVNVIVTRDPHGGAPVVFEEHPSYARLVGKIEHRARFGTLTTDFHLIRGGALHEANGGYLVVQAGRLLAEPFAWDTLKRCLRAQAVDIVPLDQIYGGMSTTSIEPVAIPLALKVVLIGSPRTYHLLAELDPEFEDYFKVLAEFDDRAPRSPAIAQRFAHLLAATVRRDELLPLTRAAVARVIEEAARDAGDAERLSTEIRRSIDRVREACYWARQREASAIDREDIERAIEQRSVRKGRVRERMLEQIHRDTVMIATDGERIGQINGLAVLDVGGEMFGRPSRITARVSPGTGRILDIEREAELGGALHTKGVMILAGFINSRFAAAAPPSFAATLAFEQSYGGIDGDSASSTELYALLSALAEVPIRQSFAVTGSVNQFGEVQAIGGVSQKIEGFFDICAERGLNGEQGVLIPQANVAHLMLRARVVEAVAAGRFHVHALSHIDQGLAILTGMDPGSADSDGSFPPASVNGRVAARLARMAEARRRFVQGDGGERAERD